MATKRKSTKKESRSDAEVAHRQRASPQATTPLQQGSDLLGLQQAAGNLAVQRYLRSGMQDDGALPPLSRTGLAVQRAPEAGEGTSAPEETAVPGLIVEDTASDLAPGQMRRSAFLAQLKDAVCRSVEDALAGTLWSAVGCPYIDRWFGYYGGQDAQHVEQALRRFVPEAAGVASAAAYIPLVVARVRSGVMTWRATGEVTGFPEGVALPDIPTVPSVADVASGVASGLSSAASGLASAASQLTGGLFFKHQGDGPAASGDPGAVQARLGQGRTLDSNVRGRMEPAFGASFGGVRVHTDALAAQLSAQLNARAFTVGRNVAFGSGEYQPGTPIGDALIAHELAHVVQQRGASSPGVMQQGGPAYHALEEEADRSAVGAVVSLWSGAKGALADVAWNTMPRLRSGLRLHRCSKEGGSSGPVTKVVGHGAAANAVKAAQERMGEVIGGLRSPTAGELKGATLELHIIPHDKKLTDLPEFAHLKGQKTFDGRNYDDLRGVGGTKTGDTIRYAIAEEQLISIPGKPSGYTQGFVAAHETGHIVEQFGMTEEQKKDLQAAYDARKSAGGPWLNPDWYTSSGTGEYFAQSTSAYFGRPYSTSAADQKMYTREWLEKNDPAMYTFLTKIYK